MFLWNGRVPRPFPVCSGKIWAESFGAYCGGIYHEALYHHHAKAGQRPVQYAV